MEIAAIGRHPEPISPWPGSTKAAAMVLRIAALGPTEMVVSSEFQQKVVTAEHLADVVRQLRSDGKTVVQCHGCFDIVHPGHVRYLEFARRLGDVLIVSLTGDQDVSKGANRPYIPEDLRAENLAALVFVDFVCVNPSPTAEPLLHSLRPDIYVKGREYETSNDPGFLAERRVVEGYGGRIVFSSGEIVFSSTALIESMPSAPEMESHRLNLMVRRHGITHTFARDTISRFRDMHVLVVGDLIIDRYVSCDAIGVASESPMMSLAWRGEQIYVGGAAIVARHVAALGGHALLLTAGGADDLSRHAAEVLSREGVDVHMIPARSSLVEKTRFIAEDTKLFKLDRAECLPLDSVAERRAALILEQQCKLARAVIFCDFGYGMITSGLLQRVLPTLRANVGTIAADVSGGRTNLLNFRHVDLLCPTEREVRTMLDDHVSGLSHVAWQILKETQARHLFVTVDKRGLVVFERRSQDRSSPEWSARLRSESIPSFGDHIIDRLGCGDALLASATMSLAAGTTPVQAAYMGNAAAALKLAKLGNLPISAAELGDWCSRRRELIPPGNARNAVAIDTNATANSR